MSKFASRRLGFLQSKVLCFGGALALLASCENSSLPLSVSASKATADQSMFEMPVQDFGDWCQEWAVDCLTRRHGDTFDGKLDEGVRQSFQGIFLEFLQSSSQFTMTRADFDDGDLRQGLRGLSLENLLKSLAQRLDIVGWQSATVADSTLNLESTGGGWLGAKSGLQIGLGATSQFRFLPGDRIETTGINLGIGDGQRIVQLLAMQYFPGETLTLELSDRRVEKVPAWFIGQWLSEIFGLDDAVLFEQNSQLKVQAVESLYPLLKWLNQPTRALSLSQSFFRKAADALAALPGSDPAVVNILRSLESLRSSSKKGQNVISITQVPRAGLRCDTNDNELILSFDSSFGLKSFYPAGKNGVGLEFYGLKASSKKLFGSLTVKRIELTPEHFSILNIPILRKINIGWEDLEQQSGGSTATTVCKS